MIRWGGGGKTSWKTAYCGCVNGMDADSVTLFRSFAAWCVLVRSPIRYITEGWRTHRLSVGSFREKHCPEGALEPWVSAGASARRRRKMFSAFELIGYQREVGICFASCDFVKEGLEEEELLFVERGTAVQNRVPLGKSECGCKQVVVGKL